MTFEELLIACGKGKMPQVVYRGKIGRVVTIKTTDGGYGCAIVFDLSYAEWFHAIPGTDKRSKYMADLLLMEN